MEEMICRSEMTLEVRYYETDQMGIVHHSNYIRYFECGRCQMMKDVGMPIEEVERRGYMMPVVDVELHYKTPARMGDMLRVVSWIDKEPAARIVVRTEIFDSTGLLLCNGSVTLGFIKSDSRRPVRVPAFFLDAIHGRKG